jgi:hypothetical protein
VDAEPWRSEACISSLNGPLPIISLMLVPTPIPGSIEEFVKFVDPTIFDV